jgi:uncharacterized membrane protein
MGKGSKDHHTDKEYKHVMQVYGALCAALVMSLIPQVLYATVALLLFTGVMTAAYIVRRQGEKDGLAENHMTFIIRTLWISSLLAAITTALAAAYVLSVYDPGPVNECANQLLNMGLSDYAGMQRAVAPCLDEFLAVNQAPFMIGTALAAGPVMLYFIYRLLKGLARAAKGYRIAHVKNWL